jgi:hypothetical protein
VFVDYFEVVFKKAAGMLPMTGGEHFGTPMCPDVLSCQDADLFHDMCLNASGVRSHTTADLSDYVRRWLLYSFAKKVVPPSMELAFNRSLVGHSMFADRARLAGVFFADRMNLYWMAADDAIRRTLAEDEGWRNYIGGLPAGFMLGDSSPWQEWSNQELFDRLEAGPPLLSPLNNPAVIDVDDSSSTSSSDPSDEEGGDAGPRDPPVGSMSHQLGSMSRQLRLMSIVASQVGIKSRHPLRFVSGRLSVVVALVGLFHVLTPHHDVSLRLCTSQCVCVTTAVATCVPDVGCTSACLFALRQI